MSSRPHSYRSIYRVVRRIPRGRVATYGQIAQLAGRPGHARQVGYALHRLPHDSDVPWHRVVNAQGRISTRSEPGAEGLQKAMLEEEGIVFRSDCSFDLERYGWRPRRNGRAEVAEVAARRRQRPSASVEAGPEGSDRDP